MINLRPKLDHVWIKPRPELFEATSTLKFTFGELSPEQQAIVARANTVGHIPLHHLAAASADFRSHPDSLFFGEVMRVGPGRRALAQDRPGLRPGDIVSYKRNRIAHELADPDVPGELPMQLVHEHGIPLRYPNGPGEMPEPLTDHVITRPDPEAAQRALGRRTPLTDEELAWGIVTRVHEQPRAHKGTRFERPGSVVANKARLLCERTVSAGPGRWVKAIWDERELGPRHRDVWEPNDAEVGKMALLLSCNNRARFRLHGQLFTVSSWNDFVGVVDLAEDAA